MLFDEDDPSVVELGVFIAQPPSVVWRALTTPDLIAQWMARPTGFTTSVGESFILEIPSSPPGEAACEVLESVRDERFGHTYTDLRGDPPARWYTEWTLVPQGRGTRLLLRFTGFDIDDRRQKMARNAVERGYRNTILPRLAEVADLVGR